jgi:CHASE2 domain-containing sensor protein
MKTETSIEAEPKGVAFFIVMLLVLEAILLVLAHFVPPLTPLAILFAFAVGGALFVLFLLEAPNKLPDEEDEIFHA